MTAFEKIIEAVKPFKYPYSPDTYNGKAKRWFAYNYADDHGANFADGAPGCSIAHVQVHFFLPADEDFVSIKQRIRKALFGVGFTYPSVTALLEGENNLRHLTFECSTPEEI